jgi:hypothetical protein
MDKDTIFIDGSFNDFYLTRLSPNGDKNKKEICQGHNKKIMSYTKRQEYAEKNEQNGVHQRQCDKCLRWFYPDEF